jgi:hypothetical protein
MKLSNQNICNLRGFQMPLGGCKSFLGGAQPPRTPQKIRAWFQVIMMMMVDWW